MSQSDFVTRGQGLVASGQYQEAVKVCRLGLLGRPTTVDGRIVLGQALLALKRYDEVLAEMRVALELDHGSLVAQALKGEALIGKGDHHGAIELLTGLARANPSDRRLAELLDEAQRASGRPSQSSSHPSVGFLGGGANQAGGETKHYPQPAATDGPHGDEDSGGNFGETNVSTPLARRPVLPPPAPETTPPPNVLAVGDRSGTMEVDPEVDGTDVEDEDFGALAAPPRAGQRGGDFDEPRGSIKRSSAPPGKPLVKLGGPGLRPAKPSKKIVTTVELDDDELIEVSEMPRPAARAKPPSQAPKPAAAPGPASRVRNAVNIAAGQFPDVPPIARPQQLASMLAQQPHIMEVQPVPPSAPISAALPTAIAMPLPASARPTLAIQAPPEGQQVVDAMFGQPGAPAWAKATVAAQPMPRLTPPPGSMEMGPNGLPSLLDNFDMQSSGAVPIVEPTNSSASRPMKTGIKKGRSRFQILGWIVVGALVIGGGVFAGFQIRSMRLAKQIEAARTHATDTAKADTWRGWLAARDSLGGIAQASATIENRAALARARALLAFEFGEGVPEAKIAADSLGDRGGLDGAIASAYVALALGDDKQGKLDVDRARQLAPDDAATAYVAGELALLDGDVKAAIKNLTDAAGKDDRALYHLGLARAYASIEAWDTALASIKRALELSKDHPGALIDRAMILAASGRLGETTTEAKKQLDAILAEGAKPLSDQPRGVSPMQVALAHVATARVELAQGDHDGALKETIAGVTVGVDDQRLAETVCETLLGIGPPALTDATKQALARYPSSRRVQLVVAQDLMARGRAGEALDYLTSKGDAAAGLARGLAVRGDAKLATGDLDGARADYDLAAKAAPQLEAAQLGRALVDLARGSVDLAKLAIEPKFVAAPNPSIGMLIAYAKILVATGDAASRDKARVLLDKAVSIGGVDLARADLELARLEVETGDAKAARAVLEPLVKAGNVDARLDHALLLIEDQDPTGGHTELEALVRDTGPKPPVLVALEAARARTLIGDHAGASQLLDAAEKMPGVVNWKLDRERARLLVRKGDTAKAGEVIDRALETSGRDLETMWIAADVAYVDLQTDNAQKALVDKLRTVAKQRLGDSAETEIIAGKLALATGAVDEAEGHYRAAKAMYDKAKSTRRRMAQVAFGLAVAAVDRNDLPAARDAFDNVEVQDPTIYDAFLFHAQIALDGKDAKKALELARSAVHLDPDLVQGWLLLGQAASAAGQGKQVVEAIARLTELAPGSEELKELNALKK